MAKQFIISEKEFNLLQSNFLLFSDSKKRLKVTDSKIKDFKQISFTTQKLCLEYKFRAANLLFAIKNNNHSTSIN